MNIMAMGRRLLRVPLFRTASEIGDLNYRLPRGDESQLCAGACRSQLVIIASQRDIFDITLCQETIRIIVEIIITARDLF